MSDWELRREIDSDSNGFDRYYDRVGGAAVLYEHADRREVEVYVNGQRFDLPWPDTAAWYGGDRGRPVGYRLRYEDRHWYLYCYVYSGDTNRSEWVTLIV